MYKHILLPSDGSKLAGKAVKQGIMLAKSIAARVTFINVTPEYQMAMDEGFVMPASMTLKKRYEEEMTRRSKTILTAAQSDAQAAGVSCDGVAASSGRPYEEIIKHASRSPRPWPFGTRE